jgi:hypothetical protein
MTEQEWLACADVQAMLEFLLEKASARKLRLFAVACCRSVWHLLSDPASRNAVEVAERFAEGRASEEELADAGEAANDAPWTAIRAGDPYGECVARAAVWATARDAGTAAGVTSNYARGCDQDKRRPDGRYIATRPEEERRQVALLRDLFGNPFRPRTVAPFVLAWNGGAVRRLAQGIDDERAFDRLPILADALADAGCDDEELIAHCRGEESHARGCWAVDLILARD